MPYADVVFPSRLSQSFSYRVPESWGSGLQIGQWVLAPFGTRVKPGMVVSLAEQANPDVDPNRIRELRLLASAHWTPDPTLIALAQWMADYYLAPMGTCLALIQPPCPPFRSHTRWTMTPQGQQRLGTIRTGTATHTLLSALAKRPKGLAQSTIDALLDNPSAVVQRLTRHKWIQGRQEWTELPFQHGPLPPAPRSLEFPDDHHGLASWWDRFQADLHTNRFGEMLTTESEVPYALLSRVIRETTAQARTVLVMTPNINLAARIIAQLRHSVNHPIAEFHSGLSEKQRLQQWQAIKQGLYPVIVGTRSALFLPLPSLGCLWIEHEGDSAYKEDPSPHYHARDVARKRAELANAVLVFHAPYPTLETLHHFHDEAARAFPSRSTTNAIRMVNLQDTAFGTIFSDALRDGIDQALAKDGGVIVYHNRKGFSSSLTCRDCGTTPQCPRCRIALSLRDSELRCSYCGQTEPIPTACPSCSGIRLEPVGFGTERLEEELQRLYPSVRIERYDGNAIRNESAARRIREQFAQGKIRIIVGTQLLFQSSPPTPVRFVGVPYADAGLHVPDFRSSERVFHHLQQAVDLLTPGLAGSAIIQTCLPAHPVMQAIGQQRPSLFYEHELAFRRLAGYPPFGHLIHLHVSGQKALETEETAKLWGQHLLSRLARMIAQGNGPPHEHDAILGPLASHGGKPRGLTRYHLLVKVADGAAGRALVRQTLEAMTQNHRRMKFGVNVDPLDV